MKSVLLLIGLGIGGWLVWSWFRKQTPIEQHLADEKSLQNLSVTVNKITTTAVPYNSMVGTLPLVTLNTNPMLGLSPARQISIGDFGLKLGDTNF